MGHYKANLRDLEFNLFEVYGRDDTYGTGAYSEIDGETARTILAEVERLAVNELAESFQDSDRNPPVFDPATHSVVLPESFKKSYQAYMDAEWWRLAVPEALGGTTAPPSLRWSIAELVLGANPAVWMYSGGFDFANVILRNGTEEQHRIAQLICDEQWATTMVLTEPDAGSDVGAGRTKAVRQEDGSWHLEGVKRFITSGDHDLSENIVHFVLARPEGAAAGTKGLSLFLVPKFHFDWASGELGERNGAFVSNVEHKMGLKVSTTCELRFGEDPETPAVGYLLGEKHDGIRQMFQVIEFARMMVGTKAIATLSTGYLNALEYAKERVQGPDLTRFTDKSAPRVTITHHPDVRRSLMFQKSYAEGMRALTMYAATVQDRILAAEVTEGAEPDPADVRLNDLLLPIVKGYGSEKSYEQLAQSLQTLGGSGYLQDYPLEQYIRDAKIDTLYEGTTAIQGQDFFFRKIVRDQGQALGALAEQIKTFVAEGTGGAELAPERELLAEAAGELEGIVGTMINQLAATEQDVRSLYRVGQNTTRLLLTAGDVLVSHLLLRQAAVALQKLPAATAKDKPFYQGKIAAAKFFAQEILPTVAPQRAIAERVDNSLMNLPEEAF
jgi:alkylation response protein AidB-like acyl-CoA dehydrogenase